ncbi:MAG: hypothetical protein FJW30_11675 [Acidobacteria bacterium]|nr:hypothetical protein [Acidobacteriota bacterium]
MWRLVSLSLIAVAQESIPARETPAGYKASARSSGATIAAEFLGHTIPAPTGSFLTNDYVVVEVAVYPEAKSSYTFNTGHWSLRVNGKNPGLMAQTPGFVAASVKYPSWEERPRIEAGGGIGNAGIILGRDRQSRFPGDRRAPQPPIGTPPKQDQDEKPAEDPTEWIARLAWQDGPVAGPAAGLLYFFHRGKLDKIKKLELVIGETVLTLR